MTLKFSFPELPGNPEWPKQTQTWLWSWLEGTIIPERGTISALCFTSSMRHGELQMFVKRISWVESSFLWVFYECPKFSSLQESLCLWTFTECHQPPDLQEIHTRACSCVSIDPSHSCCSFFSERLHCVSCGTFHHFVTSSSSCYSFPKPCCFNHPYNQHRFQTWTWSCMRHAEPRPQMPSRCFLAHPGRPALKHSPGECDKSWHLIIFHLPSSLVTHQGGLTTHLGM